MGRAYQEARLATGGSRQNPRASTIFEREGLRAGGATAEPDRSRGALRRPDFSRESDIPTNAALNYGYAVLLSLVNREIAARGCITQVGICHRNEYNQFNLTCDLMEPFRPAVDRLVVDYLAADFDADMRRVLGDLANTHVAYKEGSYHLGSVVSRYVQQCLNALNKRTAVEEIEEFRLL